MPRTTTVSQKIVAGARAQIGDLYDPNYYAIGYPKGDVPRGRGACTDVVVRALRAAGFDLQKLVHDDMAAHFARYPHRWGLSRPDKNIDHRRVPNLRVFFARQGRTLSTSVRARQLWHPGDIVTWELPSGRDHCGIISDKIAPRRAILGLGGGSGLPCVIHNLNRCAEENCLDAWKITGHYRYPKA